jgi:acetyl esterase/lipase
VTQPLNIRPLLDPEISALLAASPVDIGGVLASLTNESIVDIRAMFSATPPPPLSDTIERTDHVLVDRGTATLRVHRPKNLAGQRPCVYWMHGGGLVLGDNKMDDARFDSWCNEYGIVGVSVDYRLAPEFPYPTPLEDCYAGLAWVHQNAESLGIDATRIGIGGASAGAGLAAGLALLARDRGDLSVAFQLLIYPMIDDRQITVSSTWSDPIWSPAANTFGWTAYLGDKKGTSDVEPYAAPARATDLSGLPPTLISVGALDGFSDEDIDYAVRLRHAGVAVELHVYPGAPHGFDTFGDFTAISRRAIAETNSWLQGQIS